MSRNSDSSHDSRAGHPGWLRCSSLTYSRYARSSRLASRAPRSGTHATNHRSGTPQNPDVRSDHGCEYPGRRSTGRNRTRRRCHGRIHLRSLVGLRGALRVDERARRRALGHLVAPDDRPRHVLDAGASGDLPRRHRRRPDVRLARAAHDVRGQPKTSAARPSASGDSARRSARGSASGARSRCSPRRPSTTGGTTPTAWTSRSSARRTCVLAAGIGAIQVGAMLMALAWQNRAGARDRRLQLLFVYGAGLLLLMIVDPRDRIPAAMGHAPVALLSGVVRRVSVLPRERGARIDGAVAGDARRRRLHGRHDG